MEVAETQRFKIVLPITKTRVEIRKDKSGVDKEIHFVQGVASSTDKDLHGDKMDASAIKTMADSLKYHDVPLNADHDTAWSAEIGPIKKLEITDNNELVLEAELSEMSKANDLWYALTKQNKKLGLSIGGYVKDYEMVKEDETNADGEVIDSHWFRLYKDIDLDHVAVTSSPANPKTWVSAISKSMDPKKDLELIQIASKESVIKIIEKEKETIENKRDVKDIKKLATKIARKVQDVEASLLLELTESFLYRLDSSQVTKIEDYFGLLEERNMSMDKKDVSLEADEAKKLVDDLGNPKVEKEEDSATLENESPKDSKEKLEESKDDKVSDDKVEDDKDESVDDSKIEGDPAEKAAKPPVDGTACTCSDGSKGQMKGGKCMPMKPTKAKTPTVDGDTCKLPDGSEGEFQNGKCVASDDASKQKSTEKSSEDIVEVIKGMTENLKLVVESNEALTKRIEELEAQPAERKVIEISKNIGDDDSIEESADDLMKSLDKEIAEAKEKYAQDPTLFSMIQRIRNKYAIKARDIQ
jgi:hypothetical protein